MKRLLILFALCVAAARAQTIPPSCIPTDVQNTINVAHDGDTIKLPSCGGTATWNGSGGTGAVVFPSTIGITLDLNGQTIAGTTPNVSIQSSTTRSSRITNGTFSSGGDNSFGDIRGIGDTTRKPYRIDHISFGSGTVIATWNGADNLIDHNTFLPGGGDEVIHNMGCGAGCTTLWQNDVVPGSGHGTYIEDNTCTNSSTTIAQLVEGFYGGVTVARYNTLNFCALDQHGDSGTFNGQNVSARWWEFYANRFNPGGHSQPFIGHLRGGSGVMFGNEYTGTNTGAGNITLTEDVGDAFPGTCTAPDPDAFHVGTGVGSAAGAIVQSPAYVWGNDPAMNVTSGNPCIRSGIEYNTSTTQPATLTRCESAADKTAGCPVSYSYVPFVYPHPLQGVTQQQWTYQQDSLVTFCSQGTANVTACTFSNSTFVTTTAGDILVIQVHTPNNVTITSGTTNAGDTFTLCPASSCHLFNSTNVDSGDLAYVLNEKGGATSITVNLSGSSGSFIGVELYEITPPLNSIAAFDTAGTTTSTTCTTCTGPALTLTATDAVMQLLSNNGIGAVNAWSTPYLQDIFGIGWGLNLSNGAAPTVKAQNAGADIIGIAFKSNAGAFAGPSTPITLTNFAVPNFNGISCNPSCSITVPSTGTGHLLYLQAGTTSGTHINSVSGGGTWVVLSGANSCQITLSPSDSLSCAYVLSSTSGATSINITMSGTGSTSFTFTELSSSSGTFSFDTQGSTSNTASHNPPGQSLTLTGPIDVIFQAIFQPGGTSGNTIYMMTNTAATSSVNFVNNNGGMAFLMNTTNGAAGKWVNQQNNATVVSGVAFLVSGGLPVVSISPSPVAFGSRQQGTTSSPVTVTVSNTGTGSLTLSNPYFSFTGTNSSDFSNTGTGTCTNGGTVVVGSSCTVVITYTPTSVGPESATLNILGNASGSVSLTGSSTAPSTILKGNGVLSGNATVIINP